MNCLRLFRSNKYNYLSKIVSTKYISQHPLKFMDVQDKWKEKDGVSNRWDLIYKAPMESALNVATAYLTASTVTVAAGSIYYAGFQFDVNTMYDPVLLGDEVVIANNSLECLIYFGAFVMFNVCVKVVLSKFVVRMYKDGDEYLAIFRGNWYNSIVKHKFHLNEFRKLNPTYVVSWGSSRFGLGKKHGILLHNYFKTPEYFNNLLYKSKPDAKE
ncbi:uncharacterized protein LOC112050416 [Bicyclus anynana]|uniref:Uncharacterized protein LOC112050416 n=1 Tax=Bicyclus anynana TaxID=110368 RepID=A0A6J1NC13_BICAN|nr:uncharacterized protein LOC112050416 [Bicyclus anynana]